MSRRAFTLVELLVVISIIALLLGILLPAMGKARAVSRQVACASNVRQVALSLAMYADNFNGRLPIAGGYLAWDSTPEPWTRQLGSYIGDKKIYQGCRDFKANAEYHYFLASRAAYIAAGERFASTRRDSARFPAAFIITGDITFEFADDDADPDDYTQPCLEFWQSFHAGGLNVGFLDGHVALHDKFDLTSMTYRYDTFSDW